MAKQLQLRRGTTAQHSTFTGAAGEVTVDTDKDVVVVHDGSTAGGKAMVKEADTAYTIATVNDFGTVPVGYTTVIVKDTDRGGIFVWSASGTANGGTVFAGSSGYWIRQYSGAVNVKWFGAKGDGVTNNKTIIKNLINTSNGNTLLFENGVFMSSRFGFYDSNGITIKLVNATLQIIDDLSETLEPFIKFMNGSDNCHIDMDSNSYIKRNKADYTSGEHRHCISFLNCTNCSVTGGNIIDSGGDGIYLASSGISGLPKNINISNTKIDNNKRQGISIISGTNIVIDNVEISNTTAGIDIEPEADYYVYDVHISNVRAINNDGSGLMIYPKYGPLTHTMNINVNDFYSEGGTHGVAIGRSLDRTNPINININGLQVNNASIHAIKLYDIGSNNNISITGQTYDDGVPALAHYANNSLSGITLTGTPNVNIDLNCSGSGTLMYTVDTTESTLMSSGTNIIFRDNLASRTVSIGDSFVGKIKTFKDNLHTITSNTTLRAVHTVQGTRIPNNYGSATTYTYTLGTTYRTGSIVTIEVRGNHPIVLSASSGGLIYPFSATSITATKKYSRITLENLGSNYWRAIDVVGDWT